MIILLTFYLDFLIFIFYLKYIRFFVIIANFNIVTYINSYYNYAKKILSLIFDQIKFWYPCLINIRNKIKFFNKI